MLKTSPRLPTLLAIIVLVIFLLLSCAQPATQLPEITVTIEATATQDFVPVVLKNAKEVVIFSYEEDGYAHLFAYIPEKMPITRLTSGDWDDIAPAASPDGEKIAFASNRNGFWDLYLMDTSSAEVTQLTDTPSYEGAP